MELFPTRAQRSLWRLPDLTKARVSDLSTWEGPEEGLASMLLRSPLNVLNDMLPSPCLRPLAEAHYPTAILTASPSASALTTRTAKACLLANPNLPLLMPWPSPVHTQTKCHP